MIKRQIHLAFSLTAFLFQSGVLTICTFILGYADLVLSRFSHWQASLID